MPLLRLERAEQAETRLPSALRINLLCNWSTISFPGIVYFELDRYADSVVQLKEANRLKPGCVGNLIWRAAACAQTEDMAAARATAADLLEKDPDWTIATRFAQIKDAGTKAQLNDGLHTVGEPERTHLSRVCEHL